ncbi:MAG: hypothetical protein Kow00127_17940 [Bacteroidales bacterium]
MSFDGIDDYVDCGTDPSLDIKGPITVEAWIYLKGQLSIFERIVEKDWATSYFLGGKYGSNGVAFSMDPNGDVANIVETANFVLTTLAWNHVAGTWDGSTLKIYVNGVEAASKAWTNASVDGSTLSTKLGKYYGPDDNFFKGYMDEVRIWNTALTAAQIQNNMYRELPNPASEPNLVLYYRMNEGSGQTTQDLSQNNNTGVLGGTTSPEATDPSWVESTAPIPYYTVANGNWHNAATWANGQLIPTAPWSRSMVKHNVLINQNTLAKDITISTTGALTVENSYTLNVSGHFAIESDATGTGSFINNGGFTSANSVMERYYSGGEWHLISSPVTNALSGMFTGLYLQQHDEATNAYSDIVATNVVLNPMQGYALYNSSSDIAAFQGTFNDNSIGSSNNLSRSGAGSLNYGWNLVGNPYPSSIYWDASTGWTKTNVDDAIYLHVNASTWATYIAGVGTNGGSPYIAPGQGFFVSVTDNGGPYPEYGTLMMNDDVRSHYNSTFFKNSVANMVRLQVSGNGYSDETVVRFTSEATTQFDSQWDAHKLFGYQSEAPQIWSVMDGDYSINALPEPQPVVIGVKAEEAGWFTITATEINDIDQLWLVDNLTGTVTNLKEESYSFDYEPGVMDQRFELFFNPLTAVSESVLPEPEIRSIDGGVKIIVPGIPRGEWEVYSITGQIVQSGHIEKSATVVTGLENGVYLVRVRNNNGVMTTKVQIH